MMSGEEEIKLLREILNELREIKNLIKKEYPRNWETSIKNRMDRLKDRKKSR